MRYEMTARALHRIGKMWVRILKQKVKQNGKIASGFLLNSISYSVERAPNGSPILEVTYADYFKWVNQGRKPRGNAKPITAANGAVPIPALEKWIGLKNIQARDKNGRPISDLSLAFAIRASIWKKGIKPFGKGSLLYDPAIERLEMMLDPTKIHPNTPPELRQELETIFADAQQDINIIIENMIQKELTKP